MKETINILLLEDLPSDARLLSQVLKQGKLDFKLLVVDTKEKYIKALQEFSPHVILADHSLPSFNSLEALALFKEAFLKVPFILITAAMSDEFAVNILKAGADDYIIKDRLNRLPAAIKNSLEKFRLEKERQESLDALIKNEQHYRALIENIHDAIALVNESGEFIYQTRSVKRLTGFDFKDIQNNKVFNYVHPEDIDNCLNLFDMVLAKPGVALPAYYRIVHKDGHYIWTEGTITNLLEDESVKAIIFTYRDITGRKKAEEEINYSRVYAESIVSTIREPLIILDENFLVKTANPAFHSKFKTTEELTNGKLFFSLKNKQWQIPALIRQLQDVIPQNTVITNFEASYLLPGSGTRILLLNACAIKIDFASEPLILLCIDDITDQRNSQLALQNFSEKLEKQVFERTISLYEANIALQHSNKNLEQYAFVASHDLQEPLRKIRTYSSFLQDGYKNILPPEANDLVTKINSSGERMSTLIQQLLNFSKILRGDAAFEKADLNDILSKINVDFELLIQEKKAVIHYDKLPEIEVVPLQINQLFHNIISNSLKFSKADVSPEIFITYTLVKPGQLKKFDGLNPKLTYINIRFRDNGIGFEQQYAEKIFLIFHKLNGRRHYAGTGIGLALCKAIAINHHGLIYATSNQKEGTSFHVLLPLEQGGSIVKKHAFVKNFTEAT